MLSRTGQAARKMHDCIGESREESPTKTIATAVTRDRHGERSERG
jgi:hypothetical protein